MALTENRDLNRYVDQELRQHPVAASAHIFKGALVGVERSSGMARPLIAGDVFAGVAYEEKDNSGGAAGDVSVRVYTQGDFVLDVSGSSQVLAGAALYATDDSSATVSPTFGASYCGSLIAPAGSGKGIVRIEPMLGAQVEHVVSVPLASSTSAATTNPVMITQRAIRVISAQVSFNTVPNQGNLDVGTDNSDPDEVVDAFNLASLTANLPTALTMFSRDVAKGVRIWAKVGQASSTAGVGGMLTLRFIELP